MAAAFAVDAVFSSSNAKYNDDNNKNIDVDDGYDDDNNSSTNKKKVEGKKNT